MHSTHFCCPFLRGMISNPVFSQTRIVKGSIIIDLMFCCRFHIHVQVYYIAPLLNACATERWPGPKIWAKVRTFSPCKTSEERVQCLSKGFKLRLGPSLWHTFDTRLLSELGVRGLRRADHAAAAGFFCGAAAADKIQAAAPARIGGLCKYDPVQIIDLSYRPLGQCNLYTVSWRRGNAVYILAVNNVTL